MIVLLFKVSECMFCISPCTSPLFVQRIPGVHWKSQGQYLLCLPLSSLTLYLIRPLISHWTHNKMRQSVSVYLPFSSLTHIVCIFACIVGLKKIIIREKDQGHDSSSHLILWNQLNCRSVKFSWRTLSRNNSRWQLRPSFLPAVIMFADSVRNTQ